MKITFNINYHTNWENLSTSAGGIPELGGMTPQGRGDESAES